MADKSGIGILGLLGLIFVTLKLCGVINWSWWWVTLPFWVGMALGLAILLIACIFLLGILIIESIKGQR